MELDRQQNCTLVLKHHNVWKFPVVPVYMWWYKDARASTMAPQKSRLYRS